MASRLAVREAALLHKLRHRRIVNVVDVVDDGRSVGVLMALCRGSVHDWSTQFGPLPLRLAVQACIDALEGLEHAHAAEVLHLDLKPSNLLIDDSGGVVLSDFGAGIDVSQPHSVTFGEQLLGTLPYLAPERRISGEVDARADIYGLAATLAHLILGEPAGELYVPDVAKRIRLSAPHALSEIILRAGAYDKAERFPSAGAFKQALMGVQSSLPLTDVRLDQVKRSVALPSISSGHSTPVRVRAQTLGGQGAWAGLVTACAVAALAIWLGLSFEFDSVASSTSVSSTTAERNGALLPCKGGIKEIVVRMKMGPKESLGGRFGDFDGDGQRDAAFTSLMGKRVTVYRNLAANALTDSYHIESSRSAVPPAVDDLNQDGADDLVVAHSDDGRFNIRLGDPETALTRARVVDHGRVPDIYGLADWNGDGLPDLIARDPSKECMLVRLQSSAQSFDAGECAFNSQDEGEFVFGKRPPAIYRLKPDGELSQWRSVEGSPPQQDVVWRSRDSRFPIRIFAAVTARGASHDTLVGERSNGQIREVILLRREGPSWAACVDARLTDKRIRLTDADDINGDGILDYLAIRTCERCDSNHLLLLGRPNANGVEGQVKPL